MARRIIIGFADRARTATFYGGSWNSLLPLTNLKDHRPQWVAQSSTTAATFDVELAANPTTVDVFAFINLRVGATATVRVRASTDVSFGTNVYDSGTVSAWPLQNNGSVYNSEEYIALGRPRWFVTPAQISARYVRVNITEPGTAPPQLGCFCAFLGRSPTVNFQPGWELGIVDESAVESVAHGSTYVNRRGMRRRINLGFQALPYAEMFDTPAGLNYLMTTRGGWLPVAVVPFPDDVGNLSRLAVYGLMRQANSIRNSMFGRYEHLLQVDQLI